MTKLILLSVVSAILSISSVFAGGEFRHVVFFKFKPDATAEQIRGVEKAFGELPPKIPTIKGYEWGKSVSIEKKNDGFTHCFFVTFQNKADCAAYLVNDAHKAFGAKLNGLIDKVFVFDYIAESN